MPSGYSIPTHKATAPTAGGGPLTVAAPVIVDRQTRPLTGVENGQGQAALTVEAPQAGYAYQVELIDIWSNSTGAPTASIYVGDPAPQNEVDYSPNAGHDIANENPPIYVPGGSPLNIVFSGLSAGATVTARVQWAVLKFVPVSYGGR